MERVHLALILDSVLLNAACSYQELTMPAFDILDARGFHFIQQDEKYSALYVEAPKCT